ncbi:hypothetical protein HWC80_gp051 [Mycobacterium phage Indlulamithi]|uniref:Uncharacterized protein n=1 Tax=Mycobacterium phage Indlulamithi TaxID=2656582 RepID=A0A649VCM3_9CAUD|nr:hypothetical protein HWC80_gp051 [Mycobacterium phage Indlulamithi]QGJ90091.1 hypothetical protein PBI_INDLULAMITHI_51 [Mycobacterium phage Indlulamithi]
MRIPMRTKYVREDHALLKSNVYVDGSKMIQVFSAIGEPLLTATVCLEAYGEKPDEGNVFIKTWSENEGVFEALHKAGVIGNAVRMIPVGGHDAQVAECPLLAKGRF